MQLTPNRSALSFALPLFIGVVLGVCSLYAFNWDFVSEEKFKNLIRYLNYLFGIYVWILIIYALFRYVGLIKSSPLGNLLIAPIEFITSLF